jgi:hypothetical protein
MQKMGHRNSRTGSHIPEAVCEHEDVTVLWKRGVQPDGEVVTNKTDIIIKDKVDNLLIGRRSNTIG